MFVRRNDRHGSAWCFGCFTGETINVNLMYERSYTEPHTCLLMWAASGRENFKNKYPQIAHTRLAAQFNFNTTTFLIRKFYFNLKKIRYMYTV